MGRVLRHLLIALALLFTQQAGQLHALSHLGHDLKAAAVGEERAPPLGHPAEQCIAFHALDNALPILSFAVEPPRGALPDVARVTASAPRPSRIVFDSRAPPALS